MEIREHGASITMDDINKEIDTLQNQYRSESKKMKLSTKLGAESEEVYIPK